MKEYYQAPWEYCSRNLSTLGSHKGHPKESTFRIRPEHRVDNAQAKRRKAHFRNNQVQGSKAGRQRYFGGKKFLGMSPSALEIT
jgi:hypothetical protein